MRWRPRAALLALSALLAACQPGAAPPWPSPPDLDVDLRVAVAPRQVAVLQPLTITLDLYRRDGVDVTFAPAVDEARWLEVARETTAAVPYGAGAWQRTVLTVLPITGPGEATIDEFVARAGREDDERAPRAATPPQVVEVVTTLAGHDPGEIEAPGAPIAGRGSPWLWFGVVYGAILAVVAALWCSRRRRARSAPHAVALPPHVKALRELQRLRQAPRATPAEVDAYYVGASHVLRVYLEERFGLRASERTTEEFLRELDAGDALLQRHRGELERFLQGCDLVKFARHAPTATEHDAALATAERFVESTRPDRAEVGA